MKKIIIYSLLSIFIFNVLGYFIAFKAIQYSIKEQIKNEIKQNLPVSELTIITVQKNDIQDIEWLEQDKEMRVRGELYDIVRVEENKTAIIYYCIHDEQEKNLFSNLEDHIHRYVQDAKSSDNKDKKKITDQVVKLYFSSRMGMQACLSHSDLLCSSASKFSPSAFIETDFIPPRISI